jgi:hypothetical protein
MTGTADSFKVVEKVITLLATHPATGDTMSTYDFADTDVLALIKNTHRPTELPTVVPVIGSTNPISLVLVCIVDQQPWPCAAVVAMRAIVPPTVVPAPVVLVDPANPRGRSKNQVGRS